MMDSIPTHGDCDTEETETSLQKANLPGIMDPGQCWENTLNLDNLE